MCPFHLEGTTETKDGFYIDLFLFESVFKQHPQVVYCYSRVWETIVYRTGSHSFVVILICGISVLSVQRERYFYP